MKLYLVARLVSYRSIEPLAVYSCPRKAGQFVLRLVDENVMLPRFDGDSLGVMEVALDEEIDSDCGLKALFYQAEEKTWA